MDHVYIAATQEAEAGRSGVQASLGKLVQTLSQKQKKCFVEHLSSMPKALGSISTTGEKKKKQGINCENI
jgi:hypothetical protein